VFHRLPMREHVEQSELLEMEQEVLIRIQSCGQGCRFGNERQML
jgi:hypothetical protein